MQQASQKGGTLANLAAVSRSLDSITSIQASQPAIPPICLCYPHHSSCPLDVHGLTVHVHMAQEDVHELQEEMDATKRSVQQVSLPSRQSYPGDSVASGGQASRLQAELSLEGGASQQPTPYNTMARPSATALDSSGQVPAAGEAAGQPSPRKNLLDYVASVLSRWVRTLTQAA